MAAFRWEAAIGEETLTAEEFAEMVALKQPLVRWKGRWVRLDPEELPKLASLAGETGAVLRVWRPSRPRSPASRETAELGEVEVVADRPLRELVERLRGAGADRQPHLVGVHATLRDYQRRGVAWLQTMAELGLGALLADDMGLGKTLQTISPAARGRAGDRPHLVVCPTSVVGNWERELARFAPELPVIRHHGADRPAWPEEFKPGTVVLTSYGLLRRDADLLAASTGTSWCSTRRSRSRTTPPRRRGPPGGCRRPPGSR